MECEIKDCEEGAEFTVEIGRQYQRLCRGHTIKSIDMLKEGMFTAVGEEIRITVLNGYGE